MPEDVDGIPHEPTDVRKADGRGLGPTAADGRRAHRCPSAGPTPDVGSDEGQQECQGPLWILEHG
ncbi:hypothetical protein GCM10010129_39530 [Streptomyces fumigatiscleroticus]|nr:hypothetical protein GCM10010129_39530 [Streptomyces fumigatiscleroticus]